LVDGTQVANVARSERDSDDGVAGDSVDEPPSAADPAHLDRLATLGRLMAGIVHELTQPAAFVLVAHSTALRMLAELERTLESIEDDRLVPARRLAHRLSELTSDALTGVDQLRRLIRNVRDFAQPASGSIGPVDVNEIVTSACMITRHELCRRGEITMELGCVPELQCDSVKLMQVVINLLVNAADAVAARPDGRRRVRIATRAGVEHVLIEVEDDGCGIPESVAARMFEPFFSTKRGSGSGLGLWLTAEIVRCLRGSIDYETQPGLGTRFVVRLPIERQRNQ
jgi:signal transduction histidine kinase